MSTNQCLFFLAVAYAGSCLASEEAPSPVRIVHSDDRNSSMFRALSRTYREIRTLAERRGERMPEVTQTERTHIQDIYTKIVSKTVSEQQQLRREFFHKAAREGRVITAIFLHNLMQSRAWDHWIQADPLQDASGNTPLHSAALSGNSFLIACLLNKDLPCISNRDRVFAKNNNGITPLHEAARNGHLEIARLFVNLLKDAELYDINIADKKGYTPLHYAATGGSQDIVYLLLKHGADVNAQTTHGNTPLHLAVYHNHLHIVRQLIQHKAKIDAQNNDKMTALYIAAQHNYHEIVNFLLLKGANPSVEGKIGVDNVTPLHMSAIQGGLETVEKLIEAGASVNSEDSSGCTPLYFAARHGNLSVVEHLLEKGAQVDGFDPFFGTKVLDWGTAFLKQTFDGHKTPLLVAVAQGETDVVHYLVQHGASFYSQKDGATPFILAIRHKYNDIAEFLFDNEKPSEKTILTALRTACIYDNEDIVPFLLSKVGVGSSLFYLNPLRRIVNGKNILHTAVECGCEEIVDLLCKQDSGLIERRTDVDFWSTSQEERQQRAGAGNTPLHLAARWADPDLKNFDFQNSQHGSSSAVTRVLLENRAEVNCKHTKTGKTPLHYAAKLGNQPVVEVLMSYRAAVDCQDNEEKTPLYYALVNNHLRTALLLIQHGAKVDPEHCYPLHAVTQRGLEKCLLFLLRGRAKIDRRDKNGETALHIAAKNGQFELAETLVSNGANTRIKNKWGQTAFDVAMLYKNQKIANYLALRMAQIQHASPRECELVKQIWQGKKDVNEREDWDRNTCLHHAAQHGSTQLAEFLIRRGARVNTQNKYGQMPIHIAASQGNSRLVNAFLAAGSDNENDLHALVSDDIPDKEGKKPRNLAFEAGQTELVALLYHHRARQEEREIPEVEQAIIRDITQNKHRLTEADELRANTALHRAAEDGHFNAALFLLENGADKEAQNRYGETAAHGAARNGKVRILELLHAHGANLNAQDHEGNTPLHSAVKYDRKKSVICLTNFSSIAIDMKNAQGETALYLAVESGLDDVTHILIDQCKARGEDLTAMVNAVKKDNETPLHAAAQIGDYGLVRTLIANGAYVSITNTNGRTPLECAIEKGFPEVVEFLLAREGYIQGATRAVVNFFSGTLTTLVHHAAMSGNLEILDCLIRREYKLEEHDKNGDTPLHLAASHGYCSFVEKLIDSGVAIDPVNKKGRTPLHQAVIADNLDVVTLLVEKHAVIIHEDAQGNTPLHHAAAQNYVDVALYLLAHGASRNIRNKTCYTPFALAQLQGHAEMARILAAA